MNFRRTLADDQGGTTTLEFALCGAIFLGATVFLLDLGTVLYTQVALDYVASRVARILKVDSQQKLSQSQTAFQAMSVCPLLAAFLNCSQLGVALSPVTDYANGSIPPGGTPPFNPGQGGSLMLLQLTYQLPSFAAPLAMTGVFAAGRSVATMPYMNEY